ncbi:MAG TPA: STAS domain-containing protein, partial [Rhodocyclaceae bacterium]
AIAFANDRDDETEATLRAAIADGEQAAAAERIWLMLFDFYLIAGRRDAFAPLELEFAKRFEKQPPVWREISQKGGPKVAVAGSNAFSGDLVGANAEGLAQFEQWLGADAKPKVDLSKIASVDVPGCERFLAAVQKARKQKKALEFSGCDSLAELLKPLVAAGDEAQAYWRMLLECHQMQGQQEDFENLAVDFAVTFEISPPSWEAPPSTGKLAKPTPAAAKGDDAFYLTGEIRGGRFDGLEAYLGEQAHPVVDMAAVTRMDFASAGTLLNLVAPHKQRGVDLTLRHPNRLVAELLGLMGIGGVATLVFAKR